MTMVLCFLYLYYSSNTLDDLCKAIDEMNYSTMSDQYNNCEKILKSLPFYEERIKNFKNESEILYLLQSNENEIAKNNLTKNQGKINKKIMTTRHKRRNLVKFSEFEIKTRVRRYILNKDRSNPVSIYNSNTISGNAADLFNESMNCKLRELSKTAILLLNSFNHKF